MKQAKSLNSRRTFLRNSALSLGALGAASLAPGASAEMLGAASSAPEPNTNRQLSDISVRYTNAKQRFAAGQPIQWQDASSMTSTDSVRIIPLNKFQDILGFGGCLTDASCYVINQLRQPLREQLLHELFHPSELGLNVNRTCIGSADSAATLYSYDEGEPDPELKRFSIDHDREYILPILRRVREINPETFYF